MKVRLVLKVLTACLLMASCAAPRPGPDTLQIRPLQAVQHGHGRAQALYELGRYYHGQRRYAQAIDAYREALALEPDRLDAGMALGVAYAEQGDLSRASEQLEHAAALHPQSADVHNNLGFARHLAGDYPAAAQAYKQALRLDGRHAKARDNLLRAMAAMGAAERIARSEAPPPTTAAQDQPAWIEVAPNIFELRASVAAPREAASAQTSTNPPGGANPTPELGRALEIANGNGVPGMARVVSRFLSERGVGEARLSNQRPFDVVATRIEYRAGSAAEAAALDGLLPARVPRVESFTLRPHVRVRLVLGHDLGDQAARFRDAAGTRLARATAYTDQPH